MSARGASDRPVTFQGAWDSTLTYHPRMQVTYSGVVYLCVARNTNVTPTTAMSTPWLPLGAAVGGSSVLFAYDYAVVS